MKLLLVNTVACGGSIGRHLGDICREAHSRGDSVAIAYGRNAAPQGPVIPIPIGGKPSSILHGLATRLFDRHGLASARATRKFIARAEAFDPDIIHLHNIHGYYLHYPTLFQWLKEYGKPVVWTLHDCWPMTGHCPFPDVHSCNRHLKIDCHDCPARKEYPASIADRSHANLIDKQRAFTGLPSLTLIAVSSWMKEQAGSSILKGYPCEVIGIDIDTDLFKPHFNQSVPGKKRVLGVANEWDYRKGLDVFGTLRNALPADVDICIAGRLRSPLPAGVRHLGEIKSQSALAEAYSSATLLFNPTRGDNYPLVNREALACGTPVITRNVGGAADSIDIEGGPVIATNDDSGLVNAVRSALGADGAKALPSASSRAAARLLACSLYEGRPNLHKLFDLYGRLFLTNFA